LFAPVMTIRARGVTKGVHYIAFLAGAHQKRRFRLGEISENEKCIVQTLWITNYCYWTHYNQIQTHCY